MSRSFPSPAGRRRLPAVLRAALAEECGPAPSIEPLCAAFMARGGWSRRLAGGLLDAARGEAGERWEERRLAVLMLEAAVLDLVDLDDLNEGTPAAALAALAAEIGWLADRLGIAAPGKPGRPSAARPAGDVGDAGESDSASLPRSAVALERRLATARRAAASLAGLATPVEAWRGFLAAARTECRLPLARHVFSAEEVVERVRGQLRTSRGVPDPLPLVAEREARRLLRRLPRYEAEICRRLMRDAAVFWVGEATGSEMGGLVEHPLGTVVLAIRPPGSDLEIELKRAGRRGPHPLSAAFARQGREVPPSHRLDGGSMGSALQWEAGAAARLAAVYRRVHGEEAPLSCPLAIVSVYGVPAAGGEAHILDYFTDPAAYGPGFARMRQEMRRAVEAGRSERGGAALEVPGELGLTLEFLHELQPRQALVAGTSSLRLDLAARCLEPAGAQEHLAAALRRDPEPAEARRWADALLAEVLGGYSPPAAGATHAAHVAAAFALPANRRRAARTFLDLARQLGRLWGTVAGAGGGSSGESFVGRNLGLRSRWQGGRRRVELVAMDHDGLLFPPRTGRRGLSPALRRARALDERHVLGARLAGGGEVCGSFEHLAEIYRAGEELTRRGRDELLAEMRRSEQRVHSAEIAKEETR